MYDNLVMFNYEPSYFTAYQKFFTSENFLDLINMEPINNINLNINLLNALDFPEDY